MRYTQSEGLDPMETMIHRVVERMVTDLPMYYRPKPAVARRQAIMALRRYYPAFRHPRWSK